MQKLLNRFTWNLEEGWDIGKEITHYIFSADSAEGADPGVFLSLPLDFVFFYIFTNFSGNNVWVIMRELGD